MDAKTTWESFVGVLARWKCDGDLPVTAVKPSSTGTTTYAKGAFAWTHVRLTADTLLLLIRMPLLLLSTSYPDYI
jgi:hypothetical protein